MKKRVLLWMAGLVFAVTSLFAQDIPVGVEFARWMEKKLVNVNKRLVFIIGGPYGFSQKVYDAAHEKISMSKMTFSHQMIRLIFVEQIYRAMTILNGGPYHHE